MNQDKLANPEYLAKQANQDNLVSQDNQISQDNQLDNPFSQNNQLDNQGNLIAINLSIIKRSQVK